MMTCPEAAEINAKHVTQIVRATESLATNWPSHDCIPASDSLINLFKQLTRVTVPINAISEPSCATEPVGQRVQVRGFLECIYKYSSENDIDRGLELILDKFEDWLCEKKFDLCKLTLKTAELSLMQEDLVFGFIASTQAVRRELQPEWSSYVSKAAERLPQLIGDERSKRVLAPYL